MRHADRVRDLHFAAIRQPRRDDVLGDVARRVRRRAIDLGGILARERTAAVPRHPAVGIGDDLAPGQPGVALRTAGHEAARRVHEHAQALVAQASGDDLIDDPFGNFAADHVERHVGIVLG